MLLPVIYSGEMEMVVNGMENFEHRQCSKVVVKGLIFLMLASAFQLNLSVKEHAEDIEKLQDMLILVSPGIQGLNHMITGLIKLANGSLLEALFYFNAATESGMEDESISICIMLCKLGLGDSSWLQEIAKIKQNGCTEKTATLLEKFESETKNRVLSN